MFHKQYAAVFEGTQEWQDIEVDDNPTYQWPEESTYIRQTPFFLDMGKEPEPVQDIHKARILAMLGIRLPPTISHRQAISNAIVRLGNICWSAASKLRSSTLTVHGVVTMK